MKQIRVGIFGPNGRMGKDLVNQLQHFNSLRLFSLCEKKGHESIGKKISNITITDKIESFLSNIDIVIDFTSPSATIELLVKMNKLNLNIPIVTGTTGYTEKEEKKFRLMIKGKKILRSFNMSIGINLMKNLVKSASKNIGIHSDIEITETHHNKKRDIPSGTAISLAESIKEGNKNINQLIYREKNNNKIRKKNEIGFSSIRGGDVVGEHTVFFFLNGERIELKHIASSRKIFSMGAIEAAIWLMKKKPGLYSIMDMVKV